MPLERSLLALSRSHPRAGRAERRRGVQSATTAVVTADGAACAGAGSADGGGRAMQPAAALRRRQAGRLAPGPYAIALTLGAPAGSRVRGRRRPRAARRTTSSRARRARGCSSCARRRRGAGRAAGTRRTRRASSASALRGGCSCSISWSPTRTTCRRRRRGRRAGRAHRRAARQAKVAVDAKYTFSAALPREERRCPSTSLVDTRTMKVRAVALEPRPGDARAATSPSSSRRSTASRAPDLPPPTLHDGLLTDDQWDLLQDMKLPAAPPADPTNEYADVAAAAALGKALFDGRVALAVGHRVLRHVPRSDEGVRRRAHAGRWRRASATATRPPSRSPRTRAGSSGTGARTRSGCRRSGRSRTRRSSRRAALRRARDRAIATRPSTRPCSARSTRCRTSRRCRAARQARRRRVRRAAPATARRGHARLRERRQGDRRLRAHAPREAERARRYAAGDTAALPGAQKDGARRVLQGRLRAVPLGPAPHGRRVPRAPLPHRAAGRRRRRGRARRLLGLAAGEFVATTKWSDAPQAAKPLPSPPSRRRCWARSRRPRCAACRRRRPDGHGGTFARAATSRSTTAARPGGRAGKAQPVRSRSGCRTSTPTCRRPGRAARRADRGPGP